VKLSIGGICVLFLKYLSLSTCGRVKTWTLDDYLGSKFDFCMYYCSSDCQASSRKIMNLHARGRKLEYWEILCHEKKIVCVFSRKSQTFRIDS
jgi:hypothetical protein